MSGVSDLSSVVFENIRRRKRCSKVVCAFFFLQAEDGIRELVRSRGLGDVYKGLQKEPSSSESPTGVGSPRGPLRESLSSQYHPWAAASTHLTLPTIYSV